MSIRNARWARDIMALQDETISVHCEKCGWDSEVSGSKVGGAMLSHQATRHYGYPWQFNCKTVRKKADSSRGGALGAAAQPAVDTAVELATGRRAETAPTPGAGESPAQADSAVPAEESEQ